MKRGLLFVLIIFSISFSYALSEINLSRDSFQPGESVIGYLNVNFVNNPSLDNLKIYEGRRSVLFEKNILVYNNTLYFYISLTKEGNYTIKLENIELLFNDIPTRETFTKNITVSKKLNANNQTEIIAITPAVVYGEDLFFYVNNLGNVTTKIEYENSQINLAKGESKKITIFPKKYFEILSLKSYETFNIPLLYIGPKNFSEVEEKFIVNENGTEIFLELISNPEKFQETTLLGQNINVEVDITNKGSDLTGLTFESNLQNLSAFDSISNNELKKITAIFNSSETGFFNDKITIKKDKQIILEIPISIFVANNESTLAEITSDSNLSCNLIGGNICKTGKEECPIESLTWSKEGPCCLVLCTATAGSFSTNNIIVGLLLFVILGLVGYFIYKRKKGLQLKSPEDKFKKIDEAYKKNITRK